MPLDIVRHLAGPDWASSGKIASLEWPKQRHLASDLWGHQRHPGTDALHTSHMSLRPRFGWASNLAIFSKSYTARRSKSSHSASRKMGWVFCPKMDLINSSFGPIFRHFSDFGSLLALCIDNCSKTLFHQHLWHISHKHGRLTSDGL